MTFKNIKDIQSMILDLVTRKIDEGQPVNMSWAATEILNTYADIHGEDCDFYRITARFYIGEQVKKSIQKFEPKADKTDGQMVLDGFEYLQKAYPVGRGDDRKLVPIAMLTDSDLTERAEEYEQMAAGCLKHAEEIMRYIRSRAEKSAL